MRHPVLAFGVLLLALLAVRDVPAAQSNKEQIVGRATAYVLDFIDRFVNIVAEERYVQETTYPHRKREMRSDFLLVKSPGSQDWYQFRDVIEVDGRPIGNRDERLTKLFLEEPRNALARAAQVLQEGSRFNLESIGTLSRPLAGLVFLQPRYINHFRFVFGGIDKKVGPDVRVVQFVEWMIPSILRTPQANGELPSRGTWWIEEATGRVIKTQLRVLGTEITTVFVFDSDLGMMVPAIMDESYGRDGALMTAKAMYGRFRRFGVSTDEKLEGRAGEK